MMKSLIVGVLALTTGVAASAATAAEVPHGMVRNAPVTNEALRLPGMQSKQDATRIVVAQRRGGRRRTGRNVAIGAAIAAGAIAAGIAASQARERNYRYREDTRYRSYGHGYRRGYGGGRCHRLWVDCYEYGVGHACLGLRDLRNRGYCN